MKREVFEKGRLLEVYTDINDDGFGLGEVSEWDDDYLLLKEYTPFGEQDGVGLYSIGDIYKTAYDTEYCRKILRLASLLQEERTEYRFEGNLVFALLEASRAKRKIIDIQLCSSYRLDVSGIVESIDEGLCTVRQFTSAGERDGFVQLKICNISGIYYDSITQRKQEKALREKEAGGEEK